MTVSELLRAGTPVIESRCYDAKPGDTNRYDAIGRRLEAGYASRAGRSAKSAGASDFGQSGWMASPEPN